MTCALRTAKRKGDDHREGNGKDSGNGNWKGSEKGNYKAMVKSMAIAIAIKTMTIVSAKVNGHGKCKEKTGNDKFKN